MAATKSPIASTRIERGDFRTWLKITFAKDTEWRTERAAIFRLAADVEDATLDLVDAAGGYRAGWVINANVEGARVEIEYLTGDAQEQAMAAMLLEFVADRIGE